MRFRKKTTGFFTKTRFQKKLPVFHKNAGQGRRGEWRHGRSGFAEAGRGRAKRKRRHEGCDAGQARRGGHGQGGARALGRVGDGQGGGATEDEARGEGGSMARGMKLSTDGAGRQPPLNEPRRRSRHPQWQFISA